MSGLIGARICAVAGNCAIKNRPATTADVVTSTSQSSTSDGLTLRFQILDLPI